MNPANISESFVGVVSPHLIVKVVYGGYTNKNQSIEVELSRRVGKCPTTDVSVLQRLSKVNNFIWPMMWVQSLSPDKILKSGKNKIKLIDVDTVQQYMSRVPSHYGEF